MLFCKLHFTHTCTNIMHNIILSGRILKKLRKSYPSRVHGVSWTLMRICGAFRHLPKPATLLKVTLLHMYKMVPNCAKHHIYFCELLNFFLKWSLCKKCSHSEFFWSVFSPNTLKYGSENLRIWTLFSLTHTTQYIIDCVSLSFFH